MKKLLTKTILSFLLFITLISPFSYADDLEEETIDVSSEIASSLAEQKKGTIPKIPQINSRSYVVIDRKTNCVLLGKNENEKRKMASTTKIMTAIVIIEQFDLNQTIEVSKKAASTGGSRLGLKTGDKITVNDLLYGLMLRSGNDCAVALAEYAGGTVSGFCELMNQKAQQLQLSNSHFETPHGLDSEQHYTTAYELAVLANYAMQNKTFATIVGTKNYTITQNGYPKTLGNTNELLGNLTGIYGIKTGFTNGANRCLVTACKRDNMDIICVVLGADTKKFRTTDSVKLIEYTFQNFEPVNLQNLVNTEIENWKQNNPNYFTIEKGVSQNLAIEILPLENPIIPIPKQLSSDLQVSIQVKKNITAPILKSTPIGTIKIMSGETIIQTSEILTQQTMEKKNITNYFTQLWKNYKSCLFNILDFSP